MADATSDGSCDGESESTEKETYEHPLSITMIITKVISVLNVDSLKCCRSVCKLWNRIAVSVLHSKTYFDISLLSQKEVDDCVMAIHKGLCVPPVNFVFSCQLHKKICEKFMNFYGHRTKSLEISDWEEDENMEEAQTERYYLSSILLIPFYLKSLTLKGLPGSIASAKSLFPRPLPRYPPLLHLHKLSLVGLHNLSFGFLLDLLFAMPNLEELSVSKPTGDFLTTLMKVFNAHQFHRLTRLQINYSSDITTSNICHLCQSNLKLKSLCFKGCYCNTDVEPLQIMLAKYSSCLEELYLPDCLGEKEERNAQKHLTFPRMEVLKKVTLEDWSLVGSLEFVKQIPNLHTLAFDNVNLFLQTKISSLEGHQHLNLRELILPLMMLSCPEIKNILLGFPHMEKLSIQLNEETAPVLWEYGSSLKYLSLYAYSTLSDSCLTGLAITTASVYSIHCAMLKYDLKSISHLRKRESIGKLQNLEVLKIDQFKGHLSDISVIFGVGTLAKLKNFSLHSAQITDLSIKALEKLPLLKLELIWKVSEPIFVSHESLQMLQFRCPYLHLHYYPCESWKFISTELGTKLFSNPWFYAPPEN